MTRKMLSSTYVKYHFSLRDIHRVLAEEPQNIRKGNHRSYDVFCVDGKVRAIDEAILVRSLLDRYKER